MLYLLRLCVLRVCLNAFSHASLDGLHKPHTHNTLPHTPTTNRAFAELERRAKAKNVAHDHILLETTGLADPSPLAFTFFANAWIAARFSLDSIICVVDAKHLMQVRREREGEGACVCVVARTRVRVSACQRDISSVCVLCAMACQCVPCQRVR